MARRCGRRCRSRPPTSPTLRHPRFLGNLEDDLAAAGEPSIYFGHEAWPSPDGTRLYVGGQLGMLGDEQLRIVDIDGLAAATGARHRPRAARPATRSGR